MQPSSQRAFAAIGILILVIAVYFVIRQPPAPDKDQIAAQIETARAAAQSHNASGVMSIISADFSGNDPITNVDQLHLYLIEGLRRSGSLQITVAPPAIAVAGDTATSTSQVTIKSADAGTVEFDQPLTLTWRREDGHRFLVLPAKVWRIIGAQYPGGLPSSD